MDTNLDGLSNYVNLVGSEIDPTTNYVVGRDCDRDYLDWYANGGLAEKICKFWSESIGTGLKLSVAAQRDSARGKNNTQRLQDWLQNEYNRLDVLSIMREAELQCSIDAAAPIIIVTDGNEELWQPPQDYNRVEMLQIQDPLYFRPQIGALFGHRSVDHRLVEYYTSTMGLQNKVHKDRVLVMAGRKLLRSERWGNIKEREWGRPILGSAIINAAIRYEAAILIAGILVEKKNLLVYGVAGYNDGMASSSSDSYAAKALDQVKKLQRASNILNVALVDLDNSKLEALDRNITGVADLIDKSREFLLASLDNIPAEFIFGERNKGGLNANSDDLERNNNLAEAKFISRWQPLLNKLNGMLLNSRSCPVQNVGIDRVTTLRESSFIENPQDSADTRLKLLQGDKLLIDMGAIDAKEVRSRHIGSEFERELLLESEEVPLDATQNKHKSTGINQTQTQTSRETPNTSTRGRAKGSSDTSSG
jgi:hypothetical protein